MRDLLVILFENQQYGIWKHEIRTIPDLQTLHRLPLSPPCIAGLSIIDGRTVTLADLPVCFGLSPAMGNGKGSILILPGEEKIKGFIVNGDIRTLSIPDDDVFPLPDCLKTEVINSCVVQDDFPILIIELSILSQQLLKSDSDNAATFNLPDAKSLKIDEITSVRIFSVDRELFAASSEGFEDELVKIGKIARLSRVPAYVRGMAFHSNGLMPIIDLCQRIKGRKDKSAEDIIINETGGNKLGFLIDSDHGTWDAGDITIYDLPPIARSSWLSAAVVKAGEIVPLVDIGALFSRNQDAIKIPLEQQYAPNSEFFSLFNKEEVDVVEFSLLGARHALPKSELEDIISFQPYREIPEAPDIMVGVAEHNGTLLPVIDLATVFGRRSIASLEWRMLLIKNGDFRAFVITEAVFGERRLPKDIQRSLPILLPHCVVYGCYPNSDGVSLILNVEAMAVHFEKSLMKEFLPAWFPEIEHLREEIAHSVAEGEAKPESEHEDVKVVEAAGELNSEDIAVLESILDPVPEAQTPEEPVPVHAETVVITESITNQEDESLIQEEPEMQQETIVSLAEIPTGSSDGKETRQSLPAANQDIMTTPPSQGGVGEGELCPSPCQEEVKPAVSPEEEKKEIEEEAVPEQEAQAAIEIVEETVTQEETTETVLISQTAAELLPVMTEPEPMPKPVPVPEPAPKPYTAPASPIVYRDLSSTPSWIRRIFYGSIAAVFAILLYFMGTMDRPDVNKEIMDAKPVKETIPSAVDRISVKTEAPEVVKKPPVQLVLEIPASMPADVDVYTVIKGDTLWSISDRFTGNPFNYPRIAGENRIADPALIFPGQKIRFSKKQ